MSSESVGGLGEGGHQHYQMVKHWNIWYGGHGSPNFKFHIVKVCRTASERQMAEVTINLQRGSTLNSKSVSKRSGLSKPTLKPEETVTKKKPKNEDDQEKDGEHI